MDMGYANMKMDNSIKVIGREIKEMAQVKRDGHQEENIQVNPTLLTRNSHFVYD